MSQILDKITFNIKGGEYTLRSTESLPVSYSDLVSKRNNGELVPGMWYRITDYHPTTTQENTSSADHLFEILVQALTENTLSEDAKAHVDKIDFKYVEYLQLHSYDNNGNETFINTVDNKSDSPTTFVDSGTTDSPSTVFDLTDSSIYLYKGRGCFERYDFRWYFTDQDLFWNNFDCAKGKGYFNHSNLSAWELKYCLDNDTDRFAWADPGGYGVIYYLKDEFGNEANFDFKNLQKNGKYLFDVDGEDGSLTGPVNIINGVCAHAEGYYTIANNNTEHAQGSYNKSNATTLHSVGIGTSESDRKNAFEISNDGKVYIKDVGGYDGTNPSDENDVVSALKNVGSSIIHVTYDELVDLQSQSKLIPGQQYRITDYDTTTSTTNTRSMGHKFDIIVTADTVNSLNETARATEHVTTVEWMLIEDSILSTGLLLKRLPQGDRYITSSQMFTAWIAVYEGYSPELESIDFNATIDDYGIYYYHPDAGVWYAQTVQDVKPLKVTDDIVILDQGSVQVTDSYFETSNLASWELKYRLNNTSNYDWNTSTFVGSRIRYNNTQSAYHDVLFTYANNQTTSININGSLVTLYKMGKFVKNSNVIYLPQQNIQEDYYGLYYIKDISLDSTNFQVKIGHLRIIKNKGVIYYMKDEFGNEAGYDFKNIQFKNLRRFSDSFVSKTNEDKIVDVEALDFSNSNWFTSDSVVMQTESNYKYTFSRGTTDASLNSTCRYNIIENTEDASESATKQYLPFVVLESDTGAIHGNKCLQCPINIYVHVSDALRHNTFDLHCKNVYICGEHLYDSYFSALLRMAFRGHTWDTYVQSCEDWVVWSSSHCKNNHFKGVCQKYKIVCSSMQNVHVLGQANVFTSLMPSAYLLAITLYPYSQNITFKGNATWIEKFTFMGNKNLTLNIDSGKVYSSIFYPGDYTDKTITEFNRTESNADTGVTYEYKPNNSTTIMV